MLAGIDIKNFRAFREWTSIPFSSLTVVLGQNSAGKSSIISALLLLKQTLEDPSYGTQVPVLRLNGTQMDAGGYRDVVHNHNLRTRIDFRFKFDDRATVVGPSLVELYVPRSAVARFEYPLHFGYFYPTRRRPTQLEHVSFQYASAGQFGPQLSYFEVAARKGQSIWFTRTRERERIQHWRSYASGVPSQSFSMGATERSALFPPIIRRRNTRLSKGEIRTVAAMERRVQFGFSEIGRLLSSLSYIGPFRTPPKRRYVFSGLGSSEAGHAGEQAADLLILESLTRPVGHRPLAQGVEFWLKHLGLAHGLAIDGVATGSNLFSVTLTRAGTARTGNIADVGFGVSQILPILVQGLLVERGGMYIVQQPEIHLHPDAQANLADFFLYLARMGVRCLVETHSEYFLVRLRRRLAEGGIPRSVMERSERAIRGPSKGRSASAVSSRVSKDDVSILMVEPAVGKSVVRTAVINDLFQLENLPPDFMSQSLEDRIAIGNALNVRK